MVGAQGSEIALNAEAEAIATLYMLYEKIMRNLWSIGNHWDITIYIYIYIFLWVSWSIHDPFSPFNTFPRRLWVWPESWASQASGSWRSRGPSQADVRRSDGTPESLINSDQLWAMLNDWIWWRFDMIWWYLMTIWQSDDFFSEYDWNMIENEDLMTETWWLEISWNLRWSQVECLRCRVDVRDTKLPLGARKWKHAVTTCNHRVGLTASISDESRIKDLGDLELHMLNCRLTMIDLYSCLKICHKK